MSKTEKELAFLRDLYTNSEWTRRFTDLVDKHIAFSKLDENFLYINAGTGDHCFALRERMGDQTSIFGMCESEDMLAIARDKAAAMRADVDFSTIRFEDDSFDNVLADASFALPAELPAAIDDAVRVAKPGGRVSVFFPASGSYGEVFSLLWEVLFNEDLGGHGAAAEAMISELPTLTRAEEIASSSGLTNVETKSANEVFEFENGAEFAASPLVENFLLPHWLNALGEDEKARVTERLTQLIDDEDGTLTFRFSVKAAFVTGIKERR